MKRRVIDRPVEMRADGDGKRKIAGYAAVFYDARDEGTEYRIGKHFRERISPGAFSRAIAESHDVRGQFNHDANVLLGRTESGTLTLRVDKVGLWYEMEEDSADPDWQRVMAKIGRGDVTGSSFMFEIIKETRTEDTEAETVTYEIEDVNLFDVGPVTFPAYEASTTELRGDPRFSEDEYQKVRSARRQAAEQEAIDVAYRMREIEAGMGL